MGCGCNNNFNQNVRSKRIGNDIRFNWTIKDGDGEPYILEGKDIALAVKSPLGPMPFGDMEIAGNVISFTLYGKDQKAHGLYTAVLVENPGKEGMKTVDITDIINLVGHTSQEGGEDRCSHLSTETVDLESELIAGVPGPRGVGVEDCEQIQTSTEGGGANIWRITLTDGTVSDFEVRNGSDANVTSETIEAALGYTPQENVIERIRRNGVDLLPENKTVNISVPTQLAQLDDDSMHRTVTDEQKAAWSGKQDNISGLIPAAASSSNQLADKDYVNDAVATASADFKGTYGSVSELPTTGVDNNDYAYVVNEDVSGNTVYDRYKFNGTDWVFEYSITNPTFTAAEWAAIQSGMTAALRQKLEGLNPNWNESDDSSPAYINNRTHYEYIIAEMLHVELSNYEEKFRDGHLVIEASYVNYNQSRTDYDIVQSIPVSAWVYDPAIHGGAYVASDYGLMIWIDDPDPIQYTFGSMHIERPSTGQSSEFYNVVYPDGSLDSLVRNYATSEIRLSYIYKLSNMFLDMDSTPTAWSGKPVTSGGVSAAIANFITKSVNDLTNYYLKSETYTRAEVESLIGAIQNFHYEIYASTSEVTSPAPNVLYLIGPTGSGSDKYEEYVYVQGRTNPWVKIGDTSIDLTGYVTIEALNTTLASYVTSAAFTQALATKQDVIADLPQIREGATDTVKYTSQTLTDAQKEQARTNIGAADVAEVSQLGSIVDELADRNDSLEAYIDHIQATMLWSGDTVWLSSQTW